MRDSKIKFQLFSIPHISHIFLFVFLIILIILYISLELENLSCKSFV